MLIASEESPALLLLLLDASQLSTKWGGKAGSERVIWHAGLLWRDTIADACELVLHWLKGALPIHTRRLLILTCDLGCVILGSLLVLTGRLW